MKRCLQAASHCTVIKRFTTMQCGEFCFLITMGARMGHSAVTFLSSYLFVFFSSTFYVNIPVDSSHFSSSPFFLHFHDYYYYYYYYHFYYNCPIMSILRDFKTQLVTASQQVHAIARRLFKTAVTVNKYHSASWVAWAKHEQRAGNLGTYAHPYFPPSMITFYISSYIPPFSFLLSHVYLSLLHSKLCNIR